METVETIVWKRIFYDPLFVPETIFLWMTCKELRNTQRQMAILLDEYGGITGLWTLEKLLEGKLLVKLMIKRTKQINVHQIGEDIPTLIKEL